MAKNKYKAVIVGAGKISWSLAPALPEAGIDVISVISRTNNSAKALANQYNIPHYSSGFKDIPPEADLFLLTVPDNKIKEAANKLSGVNRNYKENLFIHFSGVESIEALSVLAGKGGMTGSIHIMQTFPSRDVVSVRGCYAAVEAGNQSVKKILFKIARGLNLKPFEISSQKKALYHLSGVLTANFLTGNFFSAECLSGNDFDPGKLLGGIASKALENVRAKGALNALSGPVERGDIETVKRHMQALEEAINKKKELKNIRLSYISQSLVLLDLVKAKNGKLTPAHTKIKKLLKSELLKQLQMF
jgi:predicted short-subunit dehydrogenase-like oxidoreductase (DUF2520 family)